MFFGNFTHTLLAWIWRNQGAQGVWSGFNCIRFIGNTPKVIIHIRTTCFLKHPKIAFLAIFAIFDHLIPQLWAKMANCRQIPRVPKCFPLQSAYNEQPRSRVRWRNSIVTIVWPPLKYTTTKGLVLHPANMKKQGPLFLTVMNKWKDHMDAFWMKI